MEGLFNPVSILLHMLNAAILLVALYFLLYKPVRKFMLAREQAVADQLSAASQAESQAQAALLDSLKKLEDADRAVADALTDGQKRVAAQQQQMLLDAQQQGDAIIARAQKEADGLLKNARDAMQRQASELAIDIASAVLEREVSREDHAALVSEFLKKVG